ncbi:MAG: hypothetical protein P4M13_04095 [Alphaproteobacteria bacterium]|nr:hypothetical protein [Alphaproteobacteria bacterium]
MPVSDQNGLIAKETKWDPAFAGMTVVKGAQTSTITPAKAGIPFGSGSV